MIVGIPKELMDNEFRAATTPAAVREICSAGHKVLVEKGVGEGSAIEDKDFAAAGAEIVDVHEEIFERSNMIVKVKEPFGDEIDFMQSGQILMCFLHLAAKKELMIELQKKYIIAVAYETVQTPDNKLPLLAPMSEVAGRLAPQIGANFLEKMNGGRGVLLGGVSGVAPGNVVVLGGGIVGTNAAWMAAGMEAHVSILDANINRLRYLDNVLFGRVVTLMSNLLTVEEQISQADLVIGAVLVPGAKSPRIVTEDMVKKMKQGSVIIDVAVDQGGCIETTRVTSHSDPVFELHGVLHYAVPNIPGVVPRTSTFALANVTTPYILEIANKGYARAFSENAVLAKGVNVIEGKITSKPVAEVHGIEFCPLSSVIPFEYF